MERNSLSHIEEIAADRMVDRWTQLGSPKNGLPGNIELNGLTLSAAISLKRIADHMEVKAGVFNLEMIAANGVIIGRFKDRFVVNELSRVISQHFGNVIIREVV